MITEIKADILAILEYVGDMHILDVVDTLDTNDGYFDKPDIIQAINELVDSEIISKRDGMLSIVDVDG